MESRISKNEPQNFWIYSQNNIWSAIDSHLKMGHFRLWRATKIDPRHIERSQINLNLHTIGRSVIESVYE